IAGSALVSTPGVDFVSFTGSPEVGQIIQTLAARNYIDCTLELGGKSPHLVFDDADLDSAVPVICQAIVQNTGQTCSAGSRVVVQQTIYDQFVESLCNQFRKLRAGAPSMNLDCGPLINSKQ